MHNGKNVTRKLDTCVTLLVHKRFNIHEYTIHVWFNMTKKVSINNNL